MWRVWVRREGCKVLVGKTERKSPKGRSRRGYFNNINMHILEVGCGYMDRIGLAQDRPSCRTLVGSGMNFWIP